MNDTNSDKPVRLVNYAIRSAIASGLVRPRPTMSHVVPEIVDEIVADFPECVLGQRSFARDEMVTLFSGGFDGLDVYTFLAKDIYLRQANKAFFNRLDSTPFFIDTALRSAEAKWVIFTGARIKAVEGNILRFSQNGATVKGTVKAVDKSTAKALVETGEGVEWVAAEDILKVYPTQVSPNDNQPGGTPIALAA